MTKCKIIPAADGGPQANNTLTFCRITEHKLGNQMKTSKQLERHFKGLANYKRLDILFLVSKSPGINVDGIAEKLNGNFKTIADHTQKLVQCGLVEKKYFGRSVAHRLSPYGKKFLSFIKVF